MDGGQQGASLYERSDNLSLTERCPDLKREMGIDERNAAF
jgi:hypothetical protein